VRTHRNDLGALGLLLGCVGEHLERTFGEEYLAYKRRVRRWV
jgi:hypothetical protein